MDRGFTNHGVIKKVFSPQIVYLNLHRFSFNTAGILYRYCLIIVIHKTNQMQTAIKKSFAVFFSIKQDAPMVKLMGYLQQLNNEGVGAGVDVIDSALMPANPTTICLLFVQAPDAAAVQTAFAPCADSFSFTIEEIESIDVKNLKVPANFCLMLVKDPNAKKPAKQQDIAAGAVTLRTQATFKQDGSYLGILLVSATDGLSAKDFATNMNSSCVVLVMKRVELKDYPFMVIANNNAAKTIPNTKGKSMSANTGSSYTICNTSLPPLNYGNGDSFLDLYSNIGFIDAWNGTAAVNGDTYIWNYGMTGTMLLRQVTAVNGNPVSWDNAIPTSNILPGMVIQGYPGAYVEFMFNDNLQSPQHVAYVTPAYTWLKTLLTTNTYKADWPENSYSGDNKSAYDYIVSQIPGSVPPNQGTVKPGIIEAINYPAGAVFSQAAFDSVKSHLLDETTYFQYANDWFGTNGIINAINVQIASVSSLDLIAAANLMSISSDSMITMIFDDIYNIVTTIIAVIPDVGPLLSGVLTIGYDAAKIAEAAGAGQPIQATVANMANMLGQSLTQIVATTATHFNVITNNYGNLAEFATGVIEKKISASQIGMEESSPGSINNPSLSQNYVQAASNAWLTVFYQALFAVNNLPDRHFVTDTSPESNPWNPAAGEYRYTYSQNCTLVDNCGNNYAGYISFECRTDAPTEVLQTLFGTGVGQLNINPFHFFVGLNGWPTQIAHGGIQKIVKIGL